MSLSTLAPGGSIAEQTTHLFWWMASGAGIVWILVLGTAVVAARSRQRGENRRVSILLILGCGAALPAIIVGALSVAGLKQVSDFLTPGDGRVIRVTGERWWWRVAYETPDGSLVRSANEIRMPAGQRVEFELRSTDVIHSFWIPSLGGKIDMIPGHVNRLVLEADRAGRYRGVCAEFCGSSHTLMEFDVTVMQPAAFDEWLALQAQDARAPHGAVARRGQALFMNHGCGACHRVAGTAADGRIGPDLTHMGSRPGIAAATLPSDVASIAAWVAHPADIKPGALMPDFPMLDAGELVAIGTYLEGLE